MEESPMVAWAQALEEALDNNNPDQIRERLLYFQQLLDEQQWNNLEKDEIIMNFLDADGMIVVVKVMTTYWSNAQIQESGCRAIGRLVHMLPWDRGDLWRDWSLTKMVDDGCVPVFLAAITRHENNAVIQELSCRVLRKMVEVLPENNELLDQLISRILFGMHRHIQVLVVQIQSLKVLVELAHSLRIYLRENIVNMVDPMFIDTVLSVMRQHGGSERCQRHSCLLLNAFAPHERPSNIIGQGGGVEDLVTALGNHHQTPVVWIGFAALTALAVIDENKHFIIDAGMHTIVQPQSLWHLLGCQLLAVLAENITIAELIVESPAIATLLAFLQNGDHGHDAIWGPGRLANNPHLANGIRAARGVDIVWSVIQNAPANGVRVNEVRALLDQIS